MTSEKWPVELLILALLSSVAGCTAQTIDLSGAGGDASAELGDTGASSTTPTDVPSAQFTAVAVNTARMRCNLSDAPSAAAALSPPETTALLTGAWLQCTTTGSPAGIDWFNRDNRNYLFLADGSWCALGLDDSANLDCGPAPGADAGPMPQTGTYSFDDAMGAPLVGDAGVGYVATAGAAWFMPRFSSDGLKMWMDVVDGSEQGYARVQ